MKKLDREKIREISKIDTLAHLDPVEKAQLFNTPENLDWHSRKPWRLRNDQQSHIAGLPTPPAHLEKYIYDSKNMGWQIFWQVMSSIGIVYSFVKFSENNLMANLFFVPTLYFVLFSAVSLITIIPAYGEWNFDFHEDRVDLFRSSRTLPTVDVFLPSAGEDMSILENTYYWVSKLKWPQGKLNVYVLDDSAREKVRFMARKFGFHYVCRPNHGYMKKAGNLRYGLAKSKGSLIAIFDADFVPTENYLYEIGHYFVDPDIGIVQSPQFFDTNHLQNWVQRGAGSIQELFYRSIQVARSRIGAPICCGTCAVYRRSALETAGGFVQIEHSEDVFTGISLRRQGFKTIYIPTVLSKGLCPDGSLAFFNQQYRWCAGSMTLLKNRDFWKLKMRILERFCYLSGFLYFIFTAIWVFLGYVPIIAMIFFFPEQVKLINYVPLIPAMIYAWIIQPNWHRTKYSDEIQSIRFLTAYAHAFAIWDVFFGKLTGWIPTGKSKVEHDNYSFMQEINLIWGSFVCTVMILGTLVRIFISGYRWYDWIGILIFGLISGNIFIKIRKAPINGGV